MPGRWRNWSTMPAVETASLSPAAVTFGKSVKSPSLWCTDQERPFSRQRSRFKTNILKTCRKHLDGRATEQGPVSAGRKGK